MALIPRFRMVAGPNGSGKTTLWQLLEGKYAINFYVPVNADTMFAEASARGVLRAPLPVDVGLLECFLDNGGYPGEVTATFRDGRIRLAGDSFHFEGVGTATTYTVALLANFFRDQMIDAGMSFSQETVFSHPDKLDALRRAKVRGFRTYLYFVATDDPALNIERVRQRTLAGGHGVPADKIVTRYFRSLEQVRSALQTVSRAFFFDNSGNGMRYLASFDETSGLHLEVSSESIPLWFSQHVLGAQSNRDARSSTPCAWGVS